MELRDFVEKYVGPMVLKADGTIDETKKHRPRTKPRPVCMGW